jgi:hypothetical protein
MGTRRDGAGRGIRFKWPACCKGVEMETLRNLLADYFRWVGRSRSAQQLGRRLGVGILVVGFPIGIVVAIVQWLFP